MSKKWNISSRRIWVLCTEGRNYLIITDEGRIAPMRKTARAIRAFNPIQSKYSYGFVNQPITNMIEDIMEKNSSESYFIQICDFVSFFIHLYFKLEYRHEALPKHVANVIDDTFVKRVIATLKKSGRLNLKANESNQHGLVIYPKYIKTHLHRICGFSGSILLYTMDCKLSMKFWL